MILLNQVNGAEPGLQFFGYRGCGCRADPSLFFALRISTQNGVRVGFRIMASLELSAEEQLSQGSQSAVCNIVSLISGENVLDNLGGGRDWQSIGVALQFNLFCHVLIFYSSSLFIALYLTIFMIMKKNHI